MPMTSKFWDKKINERRQRFGMKVINSKNFKEEYFGTINSLIETRKIDDSEQMVVKFGLSLGREF